MMNRTLEQVFEDIFNQVEQGAITAREASLRLKWEYNILCKRSPSLNANKPVMYPDDPSYVDDEEEFDDQVRD